MRARPGMQPSSCAAGLLLLNALVSGHLAKVPRFQHSMEIVGGELCVFGGKSTNTATELADFLLDYRCVDVTKSISQPNPFWRAKNSASRFAMPPLAQHTSVYDRHNHIVVPYGGQTPTNFSRVNSLAVYCTQFQAWGASTVVNSAPKRYLHTAVLQESSGDMIIYGGASDATTDNQDMARWTGVYRMVLDVDRHTKHAASLGRPAADVIVGQIITDDTTDIPKEIVGVAQHSSVVLGDRHMILLGGSTNKGNEYIDVMLDTVYIYDIDTQTWSNQTCKGDVPPPRSVFSASTYKDSIFIFGGVNPHNWSAPFNDLYQLNTTTWMWKSLTTSTAPAPRYAHQMRTLGHYLIITHGYLMVNSTSGTGDKDIYFYDIVKGAFVDSYSPKGISKQELDTQWTSPVEPATKGVLSLSLILLTASALISLYYLVVECWYVVARKPRTRPGGYSARNRIRSKVMSYADTIRSSGYYPENTRVKTIDEQRAEDGGVDMSTVVSQAGHRKMSNPIKSVLSAAASSTTTGRARGQAASDGTSTVISSERASQSRKQPGITGDNMRHTRILDDIRSDSPYVTRKLTVSSHIPTYTAFRSSADDERAVRFSDITEDDVDCLSVVASNGVYLAPSRGLSMIGEGEVEGDVALYPPHRDSTLSHRPSVDSALRVANND